MVFLSQIWTISVASNMASTDGYAHLVRYIYNVSFRTPNLTQLSVDVFTEPEVYIGFKALSAGLYSYLEPFALYFRH